MLGDKEILETLLLIQTRLIEVGSQSVFILMRDFPWYNERNGQLEKLFETGFITKPRFYDNGVEVGLTKKGREYLDNKTTKTDSPTVFLSYSWNNDDIADKIEAQLNPYADVKRDKHSVKPWENLIEYMNTIRDQDFAVIIVSSSYLKSVACMYEAMQIMKEKKWIDKVMYVVTKDSHVYSIDSQIAYIQYWKKEYERIDAKLSGLSKTEAFSLAEDLRKIEFIKLHIGDFMKHIKSVNNPELEHAINAIIKRISPNTSLEKICPSQSLTDEKDTTNRALQEMVQISIPQEMVKSESELRVLFFEIAVKCSVEEYLQSDPQVRLLMSLEIKEDIFTEAILDLLRKAPMLKSSMVYLDIEQFMKELEAYRSMLINHTKTLGQIIIVTNDSHSYEENREIEELQNLRIKALNTYNEIAQC